jgi:hypothetical protein
MMMKGMYRVALMLGMAVIGATSVSAAVVSGPDDDTTHEVRVVNNYQLPVMVYAQDAEGRLHNLGRVARGQFKVLELSSEVTEMGELRLKIYPNAPAWSLIGNEDGIRTKDMSLEDGQAINMYLESDLTQSMIQVEKG